MIQLVNLCTVCSQFLNLVNRFRCNIELIRVGQQIFIAGIDWRRENIENRGLRGIGK